MAKEDTIDSLEVKLKLKEARIGKFSENTKKSMGRLQTPKDFKARIKLLEKYWDEFSTVWDAYAEIAGDEGKYTDEWYYEVEAEYTQAVSELDEALDTVYGVVDRPQDPIVPNGNPGGGGQHVRPDDEQPLGNPANPRNDRPQGDHANRPETQRQGNPVNHLANQHQVALRIRALEPPSFTGHLDDWVSFRDLFRTTIMENESLTELHKMQYLRGACMGKAADIIKDIVVCAGNFEVAWGALVRRYENERMLVSNLIERLLDLPPMNKECPSELAKLLDGTNQVIRALAVLRRPTDQWDDILVVQTSRKLEFNTRMAWEKSIGATAAMPTYADMDRFLSGLLRSLEAMSFVSNRQVKSVASSSTSYPTGSRRNVRSHVVATGECRQKCPACSGSHSLTDCTVFLSKSVQERRDIVLNGRVCFNCIASANHPSRYCPSYVHCSVCNRHHHTLLHQADEQRGVSSTAVGRPFGPRTLSSNVCVSEPEKEDRGTLLPTAWVMVTAENGQSIKLRALIDQGSEATLISRHATQRLGCVLKRSKIGVTGVAGTSAGKTYGRVQLIIAASTGRGEKLLVDALVLSTITTQIPSHQVRQTNDPNIKSLQLADNQYWKPGCVDVLLGAAYLPKLLMEGVRKADGMVAQETIFGWMVSGSVVSVMMAPQLQVCRHMALDSLLSRFWEQEESIPKTILSAEDEVCEKNYDETTTRTSEGRYIVELAFKPGDRDLGESRNAAIRRLTALERRGAQHEQQWKEYERFMDTYLKLGHMEKVAKDEIETQPQCYLPHHAVFKPDSTTTKLRVVFDASATTTNGKGLNDLLMVGPRLQDKLSAILMRWRMNRIALCADIEKMYRQILVKPSQCDYQRIVWRANQQVEVSHFRMKTVTYGTASAPYLAVKTLQRLANDEADNYPWASQVLKRDMYVDDCMTGADTEAEAEHLKEELLNIMRAGGFRLLKWSSNSKRVLQSLPEDHIECRAPLNIDDDDESVKALGVRWHPQTDYITYKVNVEKRSTRVCTKRQMLSDVAKLFDPLGLLAPVIVTAKSMMQQLWLAKTGWDEALPTEVNEKWQKYQDELLQIEELRVDRWCGYNKTHRSLQLHGFCDASKLAYAACVYARIRRENGSYWVTLLAAKTKVAPIKQQCIPRLELNGAVLLSRLLGECQQALNETKLEIFAWTDSTVVLAWLKRHANVWPTFVANRVSEIQEKMNVVTWQHVAGVDNPADIASRGIMPSRILDHKLWWSGPEWLQIDSADWPKQRQLVVDESLLEVKILKTCNTIKERKMYDLGERFSAWSKLLRVTAYCRRWIKKHRRDGRTLEADELEDARVVWLRLVQEYEFGNVETFINRGRLNKLRPFVDTHGLMRVGGRLKNADVSYDERHPIIVSGNSSVTVLIIEDAHERVCHSGPQNTLGQLHQRYWLVSGRRQVRSVLHKCVTCAKARPRTQQQLMGDLPAARVRASRPFSHTGIDYAGPIWSRTSKGRGHKATKSWIAVFVCFSTKAVHLELVSDLTTAAFIASFRRFTARRGQCSDVYSDNGTNFVGAERELQLQMKKAMKDEAWLDVLSNSGTKFHFAPPGSPHFNGLAEATVKMAKSGMIKVIGEQRLTFEEMSTVLTQIEAAINSRPICALPTDGNEVNALTPGHFLVGQPLTAVPEPNILGRVSPTNRWQLVQQMTQHFWRRWSREYLHQLQQRQKWTKESPNVEVGDVVLIRDDTMTNKWRLGRVTETHPGTDGHVRVATMKTAAGTIKRAVQKLCVLPVQK